MPTEIKVPIHVSPRALSAIGEDLITNDNIAIIELVKNCYDAYALSCEITFDKDENGENYIEIKDDGCGMTMDTVQSAWATVATTYKKKRPIIEREFITTDDKGNTRRFTRKRVVSGNKGLGRMSAARLGYEMYITTKHKDDQCIKAFFDWRTFETAETIDNCEITISTGLENIFEHNENHSGTIIKIQKLRSVWDEKKINELIAELSRLINPFETVNDFSISLKSPFYDNAVNVQSSALINQPIYKISGNVTKDGSVYWTYKNDTGKKQRSEEGAIQWNAENYGKDANNSYICGEFKFEIRAWDLDPDSLSQLNGRFNIEKKAIRNYISQFKGLSLYRDSVLVLPKSDSARDWLGLDAKRISRVGDRLSTSQIVGIINISSINNPGMKDTTDREKLADTPEFEQFKSVILAIVSTLQHERNNDKTTQPSKKALTSIIEPLSSSELVKDIERTVKEGGSSEQILSYVQKYNEQNEDQLNILNDRLVYYAQTASLGSVASVIMHEILTGMTAIKRFLNKAQAYESSFDERTKKYLEDAHASHRRLLDVTKSFTPLYRRDLRKKEYYCNLLNCVRNSVRLIQSKKISSDIEFIDRIDPDITVQISEGELQTILINLFDNACYWIKESHNRDKRIVITEERIGDGRVSVVVSDTGTGVRDDYTEKIFTPGVTSKPNGIGMGLVIVTELVQAYNGNVGLKAVSELCGASFIFDLPMRKG